MNIIPLLIHIKNMINIPTMKNKIEIVGKKIERIHHIGLNLQIIIIIIILNIQEKLIVIQEKKIIHIKKIVNNINLEVELIVIVQKMIQVHQIHQNLLTLINQINFIHIQ